VAYLLLYIFTGTIIFVWAYNWFSFPDNGSLWNAFILFVPFIMANTFLGMAIATLFKHREEAFLFIVFLSPVVLFLSGISWPAEAIPPFLYSIGHLFPSGFMVPAYLRVRTMGASVGEVSYELSGMLIQTAIYFLLAVWAVKIRFRSIEKDVPEQEIA
jgi:ABC-2 type transport system permease protein